MFHSELDKFKGAVATFLIQNGTLKVGDLVASGNVIGKIKSIVDSDGSKSKNAGPSSAVEVLGLNGVPNAGDQFQVVESEKQAREIAEYRNKIKRDFRKSMKMKNHSIIYELIDDAKDRLTGMLDPIIKEEIVGNAEVLEVFNSPKFGQVAGCMVVEGSIFRNKPVRVLRDDVVIHQGELDSLRRFKDDVGEVQNGNECGMGIKNYKDIKPGDKIEVFDRKEEAQTI